LWDPPRRQLVQIGPLACPWREGELDAIVGANRVDLVRDCCNQSFQKSRGGGPACLLDQLHEGELRRSINGDTGEELAPGGLDLGDVDMKEPIG
jgi:hypothetical protein